MSLPRCKHCKSAVNPQRFPRCIGCGAAVDDVLPPSRRVRPRVLLEGTKDAGRSSGVLTLIGVLGMIGFFASLGTQNGYLMILTSGAAVTGTFAWMIRILQGKWGSAGASCLRVIAILLLCGVGLFFGLGILLGFACIGDSGGGFH